MYERILVPTDGSDGTRAALEHALDLARTYGATLHTLYVVDSGVGVDASLAGTVDALTEAGERAVDEVRERAEAAGVEPVEGSVVHGVPYRVILDYVDDNDVDLVVMGTHGRTGLERYLLGSVTEKVVRLSDVPVMTVRVGDETDERGVDEKDEQEAVSES